MRSVLVIDDRRILSFPATYARTSARGLVQLDGRPWDEVWLDHDLGAEDTIKPVVLHLERLAVEGRPYPVGRVVVCSDNPVGAAAIVAALSPWYPTSRVDSRPYLAKGTLR